MPGRKLKAGGAGRRRSRCALARAALCGTGLLFSTGRAHSEVVDARWVNPVSGYWWDAQSWSTSPVYPQNDNPPGTLYRATIDRTGAAYTIDSVGGVRVEELRIASPSATLLSGSVLEPATLAIDAGTFRLQGVLRGARVAVAASGAFQVMSSNATLEGVTLASDLSLAGTLPQVKGGLTLEGNTLTVGGERLPGAAIVPAALRFVGEQTLGGTGEVLLQAPGFEPGAIQAADRTLTIGPGITLRAGTGGASVRGGEDPSGDGSGAIINRGRILGTSGGRVVFSEGVNEGAIESIGGTLDLYSTRNRGTIRVTNGSLYIGNALGFESTGPIILRNANADVNGNVTTQTVKTFDRSGGTLRFSQQILNQGETLDLDTVGPIVLSRGGTPDGGGITGGRLKTSDPTALTFKSWPIFRDVTLASDLRVRESLRVYTALTLEGVTVSLDPYNGVGRLGLDYGAALEGSGVVQFTGGSHFADLDVSDGAVIGQGITVTTESGNGRIGQFVQTANWTNRGRMVVAPGRVLMVYGRDWVNQGTIDLAGRLVLAGQPNLSLLGQIERAAGGEIVYAGTLDNTGKTFDLANSPVGPLELGEAVIKGGRIVSPGRAVRAYNTDLSADLGTLDGVTIAADIRFDDFAWYTVTNGLTLDGATLRFEGTSNRLNFEGQPAQTLGGSGEVVFDNPDGPGWVRRLSGPLTVTQDITVRTGAGGGWIDVADNRGTLRASGAGNILQLTVPGMKNSGLIEALDGGLVRLPDAFTNGGTIRAVTGGVLSLAGGYTNSGSITVDGGTVRVRGVNPLGALSGIELIDARVALQSTHSNAAQTLAVKEGGRRLVLSGEGRIEGGTLVSGEGGAALEVEFAADIGTSTVATLAGVRIEAPIEVRPRAQLTIADGIIVSQVTATDGGVRLQGAWENHGSVSVTGPGSSLEIRSVPAAGLGSLSVQGGQLRLVGTMTTQAVRAVAMSGAELRISGGVLDNMGDTLVSDATKGSVRLSGGRIRGGVIETAGADDLVSVFGGNLERVTLRGKADWGFAVINDWIELDGAVIAMTGFEGLVASGGAQAIRGNGAFVFDYPLALSGPRVQANSGSLTIEGGISMMSGKSGALIGVRPGPEANIVINRGLISGRTPGTLTHVAATTVHNDGRFEAIEGGRFKVTGLLEGEGSLLAGATSVLTVQKGRQARAQVAGQLELLRKSQGGGTLVFRELELAGSADAWAGRVDVGDGALVVDYDAGGVSPLSRIANQLRAGRGSGTWDAMGGIVSTAIASNPGTAVGYAEASDVLGLAPDQTANWLGQTVDATSVLVRFTRAGDANLDGTVGFADLVAVAQNYSTADGSGVWRLGDFDYDAAVNFTDLVMLAQNYGSAAAPDVAGLGAAFGADVELAFAQAQAQVQVPEPGGACLAAVGLAWLGMRGAGRRRQTGFKA